MFSLLSLSFSLFYLRSVSLHDMGEIRPDLLSKDHPILMIMCAARCFMGADEFEFLAVFFLSLRQQNHTKIVAVPTKKRPAESTNSDFVSVFTYSLFFTSIVQFCFSYIFVGERVRWFGNESSRSLVFFSTRKRININKIKSDKVNDEQERWSEFWVSVEKKRGELSLNRTTKDRIWGSLLFFWVDFRSYTCCWVD